MTPPKIGVCPEGAPSIAICAFSALLAAILDWPIAACVFWAATLYSCWFFRDPPRITPDAPNVAVSPADGRIIRIAKKPDPFSSEEKVCISIFMNLFSVHVNRSAVAGKVQNVAYHPGSFFNAALDKAASDNERCGVMLKDAAGLEWSMVQIAGLIARRIVCRVKPGDNLELGERFGLIRFGSRVDLYLPAGYSPAVEIGEYVYGAQSVIARRADD